MQNKIYVLLILAVLNLSSYANDILTDYRIHGIKEIEKTLDLELSKKEYWTTHLKDTDNTFGYIESYNSVLTCNKEQSTLSVYKKDEKRYKLEKQYDAYTGKNRGNKVQEGDLRTPIGIYDITQKLSNVDAFYGPLALVTSYPNEYDKYNGKTGHGIWIHGLPIDQKRDEYTQGCIAIQNDSIECLDKNLDITKTILIITPQEVQKNISKNKLATILAQLYAWRYAWLYNDLSTYLNFYSKKFRRFDGMNYNTFVTYKTRIFKKNEKKKIIFTKLNVIPYPDNTNLYKITFEELYKSSSFQFSGNKVLIAELNDNKIKIITEK